MTTISKIEWTEQTWNPSVGCTKVSPGCKHCYAETMAIRLQAMGMPGYEQGFGLQLLPSRLEAPLRRKTPTVYFVNSMSDLFHEDVPFDYVDRVMSIIARAHWHTFQVLTKRADRMAAYFADRQSPPNVWLGVSAEDRRHGLPRIDALRRVEATVRFISMEPLLEDLGVLDLSGIDWVIVGGESGPKARRMHPDWAVAVRHQCHAANAAFFFKQWGTWGADGLRRSKRRNGRLLEGRTWDELPVAEAT